MKVQIDFDKKKIKVEDDVNFKKLMKFIQTLPDWEKFKLEANSTIIINSPPVVIKEVQPYRWPYSPYYDRITISETAHELPKQLPYYTDTVTFDVQC